MATSLNVYLCTSVHILLMYMAPSVGGECVIWERAEPEDIKYMSFTNDCHGDQYTTNYKISGKTYYVLAILCSAKRYKLLMKTTSGRNTKYRDIVTLDANGADHFELAGTDPDYLSNVRLGSPPTYSRTGYGYYRLTWGKKFDYGTIQMETSPKWYECGISIVHMTSDLQGHAQRYKDRENIGAHSKGLRKDCDPTSIRIKQKSKSRNGPKEKSFGPLTGVVLVVTIIFGAVAGWALLALFIFCVLYIYIEHKVPFIQEVPSICKCEEDPPSPALPRRYGRRSIDLSDEWLRAREESAIRTRRQQRHQEPEDDDDYFARDSSTELPPQVPLTPTETLPPSQTLPSAPVAPETPTAPPSYEAPPPSYEEAERSAYGNRDVTSLDTPPPPQYDECAAMGELSDGDGADARSNASTVSLTEQLNARQQLLTRDDQTAVGKTGPTSL